MNYSFDYDEYISNTLLLFVFFDSGNISVLNLQSVLLQAVIIHSGEGNSVSVDERYSASRFALLPTSFFEYAN